MKRRHWWFLSTTGRNLFVELSSIFNFKCNMVWRSEGEVLEEVLNCKEMVDLWKVGSIWPNWMNEHQLYHSLSLLGCLGEGCWDSDDGGPLGGRLEERRDHKGRVWVGLECKLFTNGCNPSLTYFEKVQRCRPRPPGVTTMVSSGNNK